MGEEEAVAEAEEAAEEAVAAETPPLQEDRPQATPEEGTIDSSDNRPTYSPEIVPR